MYSNQLRLVKNTAAVMEEHHRGSLSDHRFFLSDKPLLRSARVGFADYSWKLITAVIIVYISVHVSKLQPPAPSEVRACFYLVFFFNFGMFILGFRAVSRFIVVRIPNSIKTSVFIVYYFMNLRFVIP